MSGWEVGGLGGGRGGRERRAYAEVGRGGEGGGVGEASVVVGWRAGWPWNGERSVLSRRALKVNVAVRRSGQIAWALTLCTALVAWQVRIVGIKVGDAFHPADEPRIFS